MSLDKVIPEESNSLVKWGWGREQGEPGVLCTLCLGTDPFSAPRRERDSSQLSPEDTSEGPAEIIYIAEKGMGAAGPRDWEKSQELNPRKISGMLKLAGGSPLPFISAEPRPRPQPGLTPRCGGEDSGRPEREWQRIEPRSELPMVLSCGGREQTN